MMTTGQTVVRVPSQTHREHAVRVPMTSDQYLNAARRDIMVTKGVNPAYVAWVEARLRRQAK